MGRIDSKRRDDREYLAIKPGRDPFSIVFIEVRCLRHIHAGNPTLVKKCGEAGILAVEQFRNLGPDSVQLFVRCESVLASFNYTCGDLTVQTGHAHHIKLIKIARGYR